MRALLANQPEGLGAHPPGIGGASRRHATGLRADVQAHRRHDQRDGRPALRPGGHSFRSRQAKLAEAELAKRLPRQLGADPRNWVAVLERLPSQTVERDRKGWHAMSYDPPQTIGNRVIYPVVTTKPRPSARSLRVRWSHTEVGAAVVAHPPEPLPPLPAKDADGCPPRRRGRTVISIPTRRRLAPFRAVPPASCRACADDRAAAARPHACP